MPRPPVSAALGASFARVGLVAETSVSPAAPPSPLRTARPFEAWMLSNIVSGAVTSGFLVLLIPPFITDVTGSAARVGVVFAVIALSAMTGPVFGHIADRYGAHRGVYTLSFVGMGLAFAILALDGGAAVYSPIAGVLLGVSLSAKGSVGSGFLVGSGLPGPVQAQQLTVFNLLMFGGQIVGGLLVALLSAVGMGFTGQFAIAAALIGVGVVFTWFATAVPERRIKGVADAERRRREAVVAATPDLEPATVAHVADEAAKPRLRRTLGSPFGALMLVIALGGVCMAMLSSQIANILPAVFGINPAMTGVIIALAGLLGIPAVIVTGVWMTRSGPTPPLGSSVVLRAVGFIGLAVVGLVAGPFAAVLGGIMYLVVAVSSSMQRSPLPRVAASLSPAGAAEANGIVSAAGALGAFVGCLAAGFVADAWSYETVLWVGAAAGVVSLLFLPAVTAAEKRRRAAGV